MTTTQQQLTALGIVPRAPRLPADIDQLLTANVVGLITCRRRSTSDRVRAEHIASLITSALETK